MLDSTSLAAVVDDVNHAHFHGIKIKKTEARAAIDEIVSRYDQHLPASVRAQANPNPRWAAVPKSFALTEEDLQSRLCTFTGEPLKGASMRAIHSREAARALVVLGDVVGKRVPEAEEHGASVRFTAEGLEENGLSLYCCGPCTASVWRLISVGGLGECDRALDHMLSALPAHRDKKGAWRRFPFFFTLLALIEIDRPVAKRELEYALPECEKRRKRLKPKDKYSERRMVLLDRVLEACS